MSTFALMSEVPDPKEFSRNEREKHYTARIQVHGAVSIEIEADSKEDARRKAEAEIERIWNDGYIELDDLDEVEIGHVSKDPPMFRVLREGKVMQVSHLQPGDQPRAPDERGF
jgi:hypothetical protein